MAQKAVPLPMLKAEGTKTAHKTYEELAADVDHMLANGGKWIDAIPVNAPTGKEGEESHGNVPGYIVIVETPYQQTGAIET